MYKLLTQSFIHKNLNTLPGLRVSVHQRNFIQIDKKTTEKNRVRNIKKYWFNRYVDYVKNYEHVLEKNFPRTMRVYRVFSVGTKDFYTDLKRYISVMKKLSLHGVDSLTRSELQLRYTMRRDLIKISPVLLISAIPFTNYVIFPLAYYFPRYLLITHYWTLQQRLDFMLLDHKKRLKHNKPLFRHIQAELGSIENQSLRTKWGDVIACLGSGTHPLTKNVIACKQLFAAKPYSLSSLKRRHVVSYLKELLAIHGISAWGPFRRRRLMERGTLIKRMDLAIRREDGAERMSSEALRWALSFRGVNPANMSRESMKIWLDQWLLVSESVDEDTMSLLLHSPILLAYNHPTNWILIYK